MPRTKLDRKVIAQRMLSGIVTRVAELDQQWRQTAPVNHFVIDDLLPEEWAHAVRSAFPKPETMALKSRLRERKCVAAQMNQYDPLLEEIVYAFQEPEIVEAVGRITGLSVWSRIRCFTLEASH